MYVMYRYVYIYKVYAANSCIANLFCTLEFPLSLSRSIPFYPAAPLFYAYYPFYAPSPVPTLQMSRITPLCIGKTLIHTHIRNNRRGRGGVERGDARVRRGNGLALNE